MGFNYIAKPKVERRHRLDWREKTGGQRSVLALVSPLVRRCLAGFVSKVLAVGIIASAHPTLQVHALQSAAADPKKNWAARFVNFTTPVILGRDTLGGDDNRHQKGHQEEDTED